jgi:hypothetical protein
MSGESQRKIKRRYASGPVASVWYLRRFGLKNEQE